jgi:hypothetical protein
MFCLDIETLGVESTSVVLSIAIGYVNERESGHTWESIYRNSLFVKLSSEDQIKNYKRTVDKDTLTWWGKQCQQAKERSFVRKDDDINVIDAIKCMRNYIKEQSPKYKDEICWVRGSLDQVCLDSLVRSAKQEQLLPYFAYRDVRTAIDLLATNSRRGYCDVSNEIYPNGNFDRNVVLKHDPISDITIDILQLLYPS